LSSSVHQSDTLRRLEGALAEVRSRIAAACDRAGRRPEEVRLLGVTKGVTAETVALAVRAGLRDLGENYVQELEAKRDRAPEATWHFIGRLQRNKAHRVLAASDVVQTLEPGPAAERLARLAEERDDPVRCLVEVDFTGGRVGVSPDELEAFLEHTATLAALRIGGLMTVAPFDQDPRPTFASLRELRDRLRERFEGLEEISMGMSADLEAAVEEGATMVRVGTAIFGPRSARRR